MNAISRRVSACRARRSRDCRGGKAAPLAGARGAHRAGARTLYGGGEADADADEDGRRGLAAAARPRLQRSRLPGGRPSRRSVQLLHSSGGRLRASTGCGDPARRGDAGSARARLIAIRRAVHARPGPNIQLRCGAGWEKVGAPRLGRSAWRDGVSLDNMPASVCRGRVMMITHHLVGRQFCSNTTAAPPGWRCVEFHRGAHPAPCGSRATMPAVQECVAPAKAVGHPTRRERSGSGRKGPFAHG